MAVFLKRILPHHGLLWQSILMAILGVLLFMIQPLDFAFDDIVDDLPDRHAGVNPDGDRGRNLERPEAAEADVTLSSRSMDVDAESSRRRLSFEEGDMLVCLSVFECRAEVELPRLEHEAFLGDLEVADLVVLLRVDHAIDILGEMLGEVYVV